MEFSSSVQLAVRRPDAAHAVLHGDLRPMRYWIDGGSLAVLDVSRWTDHIGDLDALNVATQVHTSPAMFGKVMSTTKPRMAVGYHVFNDFDTQPQILSEIRQTYDGPVELAIDYMVFNVTKDDVKVRMAAVDEDIWPLPSVTTKLPANPKDRIGFSKFITQGRVVYKDVIKFYYDQANEMFGTDFDPPK